MKKLLNEITRKSRQTVIIKQNVVYMVSGEANFHFFL